MMSGRRLAELLGALSVATDHVAGLPAEAALSASVVAVRLGRVLGLAEIELAEIYYAALLRFVGCTATAMEAASMGAGEDLSLNYSLALGDWQQPAQVEAALRENFARQVPASIRDAAIRAVLDALPGLPAMASLHCLQAQVLARRLQVPGGTPALLGHMHARWDGKYPGAVGEAIPIGERVIALAVIAELVRRAAGPATALEVVALRCGKQLDPALCRLATAEAKQLFRDLDGPRRWDCFLDSEPGDPRMLDRAQVAAVATAFADFVDQKSPWLLGHSRRVAALTFLSAEAAGLASDERETLRIAALLHDIGRAGVSNAVWDKPGPLSPAERVKAESHSMFTEQVLALAPSFADLRDYAAATHERADGGGYHRRVALDCRATGLLAAADIYDALTHDRPWRGPLAADAAAEVLIEEASKGKLLRDCARAVLDAAGAGKRTSERVYPAGLTAREVEVIQLLARGGTTQFIGERLGISPKTADHHIQHIYDKCGVRGRAAIALYAVEHQIVDQ